MIKYSIFSILVVFLITKKLFTIFEMIQKKMDLCDIIINYFIDWEDHSLKFNTS